MKNKFRFILCGIILLLICLIIPGFYNAMHVVRYNLHSAKIGGKISIALITDLHSCSYGTGQSTLIDTIDKEKPDLVLLGGDIFDQNLPDDNAIAFLQKVSSRYPCYFVTGNHEYHKGKHAFSDRMAILDACGITRLSGEMASVEINGTHLNICGLDDPYEWAEGIEQSESDLLHFHEQLKKIASWPKDVASYTILLTHRPEMFELYRQYDFDLVAENQRIADSVEPDATTSLQRDIAGGGRSEFDTLIMDPVRLGEEYGLEMTLYREVAERFGKL